MGIQRSILSTAAIVVFIFASSWARAQESLRVDFAPPTPADGTISTRTDIPWQPPQPENLSEIYNYSVRSNTAIGSGASIPNSPLGRTMSSTTQSHLLGLRYGLTEKWALRFVVAAQDNQYNLQNGPVNRTVYVEGLGDCKLQGVYTIYKDVFHRFEAYGGTTIPTGATDLTGPDGSLNNPRNQLGSGTFDLIPGVSYTFTKHHWTLGDRIESTIHTGKNSSGYRLGDDFSDTAVISYEIMKIFSPEINMTVRNKQKNISDHPMSLAAQKKNNQPAGVDPGTGLPGPSDPSADLNRAGTSFDGTASLVSHIPLEHSPVAVSVMIGVPLFRAGAKPDSGMQTNWFAGSSISSSF
jgi:hypothetical protein